MTKQIEFPVLALVVSGGHTQLILMKEHLKYEIVGQTLDDAAGEAFDKVARILNLGYPGGPAVAEEAKKCKIQSRVLETKFKITLPRPMLNKDNFDFSFSGLKTAVLYKTKKNPGLLKNKTYIAELAYEFQQAVVDVLAKKTLKAARSIIPKPFFWPEGFGQSRTPKAAGRGHRKGVARSTVWDTASGIYRRQRGYDRFGGLLAMAKYELRRTKRCLCGLENFGYGREFEVEIKNGRT